MEKLAQEVRFAPKSPAQRTQCINAECFRRATLEAILNTPRGAIRVPCCNKARCRQMAATTARELAQAPPFKRSA